jgi:methyl halide transferase
MPTDWESHYQAGDMPWEKGGPSPGLVDFLTTQRVTGHVLAPGCGLGHDVRVLSAQGAEVTGLDISPSAVEAAKRIPTVGSERYECADLFALPGHLRGAFDWVWEHTCFCAIDLSQRAAYVEGVHAALRSGGRLLAIFYLDPGNDSPDEGPPFEVSLAELDRLFSPRFELVREWLPERAYPGREGREWMREMRRRD